MKTRTGCTLALLLLGTTLPALAEEAPVPAYGPLPFSAYDTNRDGLITEQEFNAARDRRIAERVKEGRPMQGMASAPGFAELDTDGDGKLTPAELEQGQQQRAMGRPGQGGGMGPGGAMGPGAAMGQGQRGNMPAFADFDSNGDGVLSEQEFVDSRNRRIAERAGAGFPMRGLSQAEEFKDVDRDGDGRITPEEFAAHQAGHMRNPPMPR